MAKDCGQRCSGQGLDHWGRHLCVTHLGETTEGRASRFDEHLECVPCGGQLWVPSRSDPTRSKCRDCGSVDRVQTDKDEPCQRAGSAADQQPAGTSCQAEESDGDTIPELAGSLSGSEAGSRFDLSDSSDSDSGSEVECEGIAEEYCRKALKQLNDTSVDSDQTQDECEAPETLRERLRRGKASAKGIGGKPPKVRAIHLYSGDTDRPDGIRAHLDAMKGECEDVDIVNAKTKKGWRQHDLGSAARWGTIEEAVKDRQVDAVCIDPPCHTFSRARNNFPGPPILRTRKHPYGVPWLKEKGCTKGSGWQLPHAPLNTLGEDCV